MGFANIQRILKTLQLVAKKEEETTKLEEGAFLKEHACFPQTELTPQGYPHWGYHNANKLLKEDVKSGLANNMKPMKLWQEKAEYQEFPPRVFLGHVHQEKRSQREAKYWVVKRNRDAQRKRDKEVEEMKEKWIEQHCRD